jgi:hypothetical protein
VELLLLLSLSELEELLARLLERLSLSAVVEYCPELYSSLGALFLLESILPF